jgi:hypothetical protein
MKKSRCVFLTIILTLIAGNLFAQNISKAGMSDAERTFLTIGGAILLMALFSSIGRGLKSAFAKKNKVILSLVSGEEVSLEKVRVTLNESIINCLISEKPKKVLNLDLTYNEEERSILETTQNIPFSEFCINTFKFIKSGIIEQLMKPDSLTNADQIDNLSENDTVKLKDIIEEFSGTWQQEGIPHLDAQMKLFFKELLPLNHEFIIGYADRQVLTNQRFVIFSKNPSMSICRILLLSEIRSYTIK